MESLDTNLTVFFQWLLRATLQGSLLVCLILAIKLALREKLPARWHYCLWLVLLVRLSLPWAPQSRLSIYNMVPRSLPSYFAGSGPADDAPPDAAGAMPYASGQQGGTGPASVPAPGEAPQRGQDGAAASVLPAVALGQSDSAPMAGRRLFAASAAAVAPWLWLTGCLVLGGYVLGRAFGLWWVIRSERPVTDQQILDLLEDCKMQIRVRTIVGVVVTDRIQTPALFGFLRPRILLPQGLMETLGLDGLHHVFLHELAHLKRRDIWLAWLVCLLQVLHWFNPLIWFAFQRMRADQEMAADGLVLATAAQDESRHYGQTILSLLERFSRPQHLPSLAGVLENPSHVERRIRGIARFRVYSRRRSALALVLVILVGCVSLTDAGRGTIPKEAGTGRNTAAGSWVNYTGGTHITAMAEDGDYIWVGGSGGLTKLHKMTGAMIHYNRANSGLPDNGVSSIARDAKGTLWIGTRGGLAQFDGTHWMTYRSETCSQPGNGVSCLAIDENGVKWIGVYGRGLARFDGTNWTFYTKSNSGLPSDDFRSIGIDAKENKWLGTNGKGLAKFDGSNWTVYNPGNSGIPGVGVYPIAFDLNGDLWVGCQGWNNRNGLAKFDGANWTVYDEYNSQLPANCVRSIAVEADGSKWIGTYRGLAKFDGTNWTVYDTDRLKLAATDCMSLPDKDLWTILVDSEGIKWLGFYGGLVRFDGTNWAIYNVGNSLLPDDHITSMAIGADGTRWIGTWGGGLAKFDGVSWAVYNGLNSRIPGGRDVTQVFAVDDDGAAWVGIYGGGLARFDGTTWTFYTTENSGLPGEPSCVAVDADGHKWIGTANGLAVTDGLEWTVYRSDNSPLPSDEIGVIAIDKDGNKWIGGGMPSPVSTKGPKGLTKFDGTNWTVYNTDNSGLPGNQVLCLVVDPDGNKWIGTDRGLARFDGTTWTVYGARPHWLCVAPDGSVCGLEASKGSWNMFRVRDDAWTVITLDDSGLPSFRVNCFCVGPRGDFWFGTEGGLGCLTRVDLSTANKKSTFGVASPFGVARVQREADRPIALPVPLAKFPRTLNGWTGEDLLIPATTQEYMQANRPDDYFYRRYVNGDTGHWADLYVVYCSFEPVRVFGHQPRDCYPVNGWTWDQTDPLRIVTQSGRGIGCLVDRFHRSSPVHQDIVVLSFYVLNGWLHAGNQDLVGFWPQDRNASRDPARYAAQVQVASDLETSAQSAACAMADTILEFLPDPNGVVRSSRQISD